MVKWGGNKKPAPPRQAQAYQLNFGTLPTPIPAGEFHDLTRDSLDRALSPNPVMGLPVEGLTLLKESAHPLLRIAPAQEGPSLPLFTPLHCGRRLALEIDDEARVPGGIHLARLGSPAPTGND